MNFLKKLFLKGILIGLPIIITIYILVSVIEFFDNLVWGSLFYHLKSDSILFTVLSSIPGVGLLISVIFIVIIGFIASNFFGRFFISLSENILNKIPIVKSIYSTIKQIFDTVLSSNSNAFKEAVLVEYPKEDSWVIGFVTGKTSPVFSKMISDETYLNVFVPTTPNPTSGFLLFVPERSVKPIKDIKVDALMKIIISGGVLDQSDHK